ncbi:conserved membrane hypothetical protein [Nostocoides australiense Ben110]|uniref:Major facilitator superfamily (MFS) profile domain-containing protein n=1 Tax=Nostocoides australiense Ben110 TaxID=1193182 RepID=W6JUL0_9MICO|nr:conserved membrane hypothetical protein [Tetrasphaera australiensis Ben110]
MVGFFMILVDSTIVAVGTPALMAAFDTDVTAVLWVTSAYLLAYAVPLLITGRLGDRLGPKRVYLAGLTLFTLASLWCGLSGELSDSIGMLVVARVFQGLGASLMTPQTMAVITRTFPPERRGSAMALWGAAAGVATLVGPILGGVLLDSLGWEWMFFINVPVGIIGWLLAWRLVPRLETHSHSFDWVGVALSAVGLFCGVFAIQEGHAYDWGQITGVISVPLLLVVGAVLLGLFVWWQSRIRREPLVPLGLFRDRNFSVSNVAISTVGFAITAMMFPFMIYAQAVRGLSPTRAALLLAPQAVMSIVLAPIAGKLTDRMHPRLLAGFGLLTLAAVTFALSRVMTPGSSTWSILLVALVLGVANSFVWGPLATSANRNLPPHLAGAGAGVYNTTRQIGAVLGSAAIAVLMEARIAALLPGMPGGASSMAESGAVAMPEAVKEPFAQALAESMLLPAAVVLLGFAAALFFERPRHQQTSG